MGSLTALGALHLPVRLRGIQLGRPVDLLLETGTWNALGFVVRCRDESQRFLPLAAAQTADDEIRVGSTLLLLEDVGFYLARGTSCRSLLGGVEQRASCRPAPRSRARGRRGHRARDRLRRRDGHRPGAGGGLRRCSIPGVGRLTATLAFR